MNYQNDLAFARAQDAQDPLKDYRNQFYIPQVSGKDSLYFTGNSLGLQPKSARKFVEEEMKNWETLGVEGHFADVKRPWINYHKFSKEALAKIVGAKPI
jgi:kynureninase